MVADTLPGNEDQGEKKGTEEEEEEEREGVELG